MWDRLRTANGPAAAAPPAAAIAHSLHAPASVAPPPPLASRSLHGTGGTYKPKQRLPRMRGGHSLDLDDPLDALGISQNAPYRFEIRRGKVVPQAAPADVSLPQQQQQQQQQLLTPPPRNPRRRLHLRHHPQDESSWRPASSVYEQSDDSPDDSNRRAPKPASADMYGRPPAEEQVSPPSSPDLDGAQYPYMTEDVSPIDDEPDRLQRELLRAPSRQPAHAPAQQYRSGVPVPQYAHRAPAGAAGLTAPRLHDVPRDRGPRNHQAYPALRPIPQADAMRRDAAAGNVPPAAPQIYGSTTVVTSPADGRRKPPPTLFGQRMRLMGRSSKPEPIDTRPPWHGASGRTRQLQPVRDDAAAAPLQAPRRSNNRRTPPDDGGAPSSTVDLVAARQAAHETPGANVTAPSARRTPPLTSNQETGRGGAPVSSYNPPHVPRETAAQSYPSPPEDYPAVSPQPTTAPLLEASPALSALTANYLPSEERRAKSIKRKPPPAASVTRGAIVPRIDTGSALPKAPAHDGWAPPPSRFSVTTYAPSNPGTPRQSLDEPPVPALPQQPASVMDRRRPVAGRPAAMATPDPIMISMGSPFWEQESDEPSGGPAARTRVVGGEQQLDRRSSIASMAKPLPTAPHEQSTSNDRVANLNAQIQGLVHRRININRSIRQMTELMPTDNLMASQEVLRKRATEKQKVDALKEELAEIQREEYDLGLKLHRAYKRLDKEAEYEPTTLWVRRVTG